MEIRKPLTLAELRRAHKQVGAVFTRRDNDDEDLTDAELLAYGYDEGFLAVVHELTLDLLGPIEEPMKTVLEVEIATGCIAMACVVGQALNNRESGE